METPDYESDPTHIDSAVLDVLERHGDKGITLDEQRSLRAVLKSGVASEDLVPRILALLNPHNAPVVSLTPEERAEYICVSWGGNDNYAIQTPIRMFVGNIPLVFDRVTCLYYTKRPEGIKPLW